MESLLNTLIEAGGIVAVVWLFLRAVGTWIVRYSDALVAIVSAFEATNERLVERIDERLDRLEESAKGGVCNYGPARR